MKRLSLLRLAVPAVLLGAALATASAEEIKWVKTYDEAVKLAKKTKKPIFIDFYTDWCTACKVLDRTHYKSAKVAAAASKFVSIKLNAEKEGEKLADKYKINSYPTLLFITPEGKVLLKIEGAPVDENKMIGVFDTAAKQSSKTK